MRPRSSSGMRSDYACILALLAAGCSAHAEPESEPAPGDAGTLQLTSLTPVDASFRSTLDAARAGRPVPRATSLDAALVVEAAVALDAAADAPPSRFITEVIDFHQGTCAGWNADDVLETVSGPPLGAGIQQGSLDVVSLGGGGWIDVGFGANSIVDGDGIDFVVFENPFDIAGSSARYAEPGEVSVSEDGKHWTRFPCTDTTHDEPDGGWDATRCGGIHPVISNPNFNDISPFDLAAAGGDQYDLAWIGVKHANYVRIRNMVVEDCVDAGAATLTTNGFDLDAIAIIHAALP